MKRSFGLLSAITLFVTTAAYPATRFDAESGRLSLDYTGTSLASVLVDIATACQVDLVIVGPCDQQVSLTMDNVPFQDAAIHLQQTCSHRIRSEGDTIRATPKDWPIDSDSILFSDLLAKHPALPDEYDFSVEFINEPLRTHLRNIADLCELNLVVPVEFPGQAIASIRLCQTTWRAAFRELLLPVGYTFVEDQNIVRLIPILPPSPPGKNAITASEPHSLGNLVIFARAPVVIPIALAALVHLALAFGAARKPLPRRALFAPKWIWIATIAIGGVLPLLAFWAMHFSRFASTNQEETR